MPLRFLRERAVGHRQELLERLQHDDFGAEAAPHAAELEPDDARADDAKPLRHRVEFERAPGIHDLLAVELDAAQRHRLRAGGDHHVLGLQRALRAVGARELDLAAGQQLSVAAGAA